MNTKYKVSKIDSLKDLFVKKFEELIISGKISIGEHLPPEREIALKTGISRTIVHSGLIELAAKGLITIYPRKGTIVNDYRKEGTMAVLNSLMNYKEGDIEPVFLDSIISTRYLIEVEFARLAALNRSIEDLEELKKIIETENTIKSFDAEAMADIDFAFHHQISIATGNIIYPLIIKSFEPVYKNLTLKFFKNISVLPVVFDFHQKIYTAIERRSSKRAADLMKEMLIHGENVLKEELYGNSIKLQD